MLSRVLRVKIFFAAFALSDTAPAMVPSSLSNV